MPGLMSSSTSLSVFKIENPKDITLAKLKQHAFKSIDNSSEEKAWGWVSSENMFDTDWIESPEKGEFIVFSLRVDTRKVPSAILNKHLKEALQKEKDHSESGFISIARKKELKELHSSKLLSKTEPAPSVIDIAVDSSNGLVYIFSTSNSALLLIAEHMTKSFGQELVRWQDSVTKGTPKEHQEKLIAMQVMRDIYDSEQNIEFNGHTYALFQSRESGRISLSSVNGDNAEVTSKNEPDSVNAGLETGLQISKLAVEVERMNDPENKWSFTWDNNCNFSGLKTPQVATFSEDDAEAALLEKLYLISQAVGAMSTLFQTKAKS